MYRYDSWDQALVQARVAQYRDQLRRFLAGELGEDEFRPLRLQNGLYVQRHAPMLRVAIPYGLLEARQLRMLADIARRYDRGYGHFTTRQNLQFNWIRLEDTADILERLAEVGLHAIQTSGNCIRNLTTDPFAGAAPDERVDPRPWCELIRQWSSFHPEFAFLPRKFKIAVHGAEEDRVLVRAHDIGLELLPGDDPLLPRVRVFVGGGLGRTPILGKLLYDDVPAEELFTVLEAILHVYNRHGRRDNLYKARVKILVQAIGVDAFRAEVDAYRAELTARGESLLLTREEIERVAAHFDDLRRVRARQTEPPTVAALSADEWPAFTRWRQRNVHLQRQPGYALVVLITKRAASAPGDVSAEEMEAIADWAERYGDGEIRVTHEQNLALAWVREETLPGLWREARALGFGHPSFRLAHDLISCPGGDYCALANARSIPVAQALLAEFAEAELEDIGPLSINVSGCMNACGHHHVGHIGVLGVDKNGEEWFQVTIGGRQGNDTRLGKVIGPAFRAEDMPRVARTLVETYRALRAPGETFLDTLDRLGPAPFKEAVYAGTPAARHPALREAANVEA